MPNVESSYPEGGRPALRRYIREPNGAVEYETHNQQEGVLRFSAAISHIALVRFLLIAGGEVQFELSEETADDLIHYEIGVQAKDNKARLVLFRKPEVDPAENQPKI